MAELDDLKAIWLDLRAHVDQLASEREQYLEFFERSSDAYLATDAQGTITDVNGAAVDVLQRRRRYLHGKPIAALVALERRTEFRSRLRGVMEREPGAARRFTTVFEAPELRIEVTVTLRVIERAGKVAGACWLLQPVQ
jgi:PAS domain S-box-containing protein